MDPVLASELSVTAGKTRAASGAFRSWAVSLAVIDFAHFGRDW